MDSFLATYNQYFSLFSSYFSKDVNLKIQSNTIDIQAFLLDMEIFNKRKLLRLLNIDYFLNLFFHIQVDHTNPKLSK